MTRPQQAQPIQPEVLSMQEWLQTMTAFAEKQQELMDLLAKKGQKQGFAPAGMASNNWQEMLSSFWGKMVENPQPFLQAQFDLYTKQQELWQNTMARLQGQKLDPIVAYDKSDRRFRDARWHEQPLFDHLRQNYLLTSQWLQKNMQLPGDDKAASQKWAFYLRQMIDAASPSNFWLTNPEVLEATLTSRGKNLLQGLDNVLQDLKASDHLPKISMSKKGMFEVGRNLATTPGKVVFENHLLQLIQYTPLTAKVYKTPLLIIPPWINKYYILDMQAENSFVRWAVEQGHTVFMISWVNPDESHRDVTFADYGSDGIMAALGAIEQATGEKEANVIGYCIGGTALTMQMALLAAQGKKSPVKSATYFVTLIDFEDSGELTIFTDEEQISLIESLMAEKGYLDASHMHVTFNMLRANDLIWSFVVNNYLLGKEPFPFDLLHWNCDSTNIPATAHSFYLRNMYLQNNLAKGKLVVDGKKLDVGAVKTPAYFISAIEDHIAPWQATYRGTHLLGGDVTFTLSGSGHIAGVVNPPVKNKYQYWTNDKLPKDADKWLAGATSHPGSWWTHWAKWIKSYAGPMVTAREPGKGKLKVIENAPGRYVKGEA